MRTIPNAKGQTMDETQQRLNETTMDFVDRIAKLDPTDDNFATGVKNIQEFTKIQIRTDPPPPPPSAPAPEPTPWERVKSGAASIWDNETTRVLIKAGGAFAGVGLVTWTTVHRDHVMERNALAQANQRTV